jgi:hypothetical protein
MRFSGILAGLASIGLLAGCAPPKDVDHFPNCNIISLEPDTTFVNFDPGMSEYAEYSGEMLYYIYGKEDTVFVLVDFSFDISPGCFLGSYHTERNVFDLYNPSNLTDICGNANNVCNFDEATLKVIKGARDRFLEDQREEQEGYR